MGTLPIWRPSLGKDMAVTKVALKIWYTEGTKHISLLYGQTVHHLYMSGGENSTKEHV
jgi:hypothetical protein